MLILTIKEVNMTIEKQTRPAIDSDLNGLIQTYANNNFNGNFTKAANSMIRSFVDDDNLERLNYLSTMIEAWFDSRFSQRDREMAGVDVPLSHLVRDLFDITEAHTYVQAQVKCKECGLEVSQDRSIKGVCLSCVCPF